MKKINWLKLETRINKALRAAFMGDMNVHEALVRIDSVMADELGRGSELEFAPEGAKVAIEQYLPKGTTIESLQDEEWPDEDAPANQKSS